MRKEKRRSDRIDCLIAVRYSSVSGDLEGNSLTQDISGEGIALPIDGKIPPGTRLNLTMMLEKAKKEITAVAAVIWARRNTHHWRSRYSAGLKFIEINPDDKQALIEYAGANRWIKSDFEWSLEENKIPRLGERGEFTI
ncbi:MAG: PilZ domain-containing protein [Candidatus Omnitrophica bacterium]|nr:PilZ domain-containing protein [Candidatus Omnitrophota bacterium]